MGGSTDQTKGDVSQTNLGLGGNHASVPQELQAITMIPETTTRAGDQKGGEENLVPSLSKF